MKADSYIKYHLDFQDNFGALINKIKHYFFEKALEFIFEIMKKDEFYSCAIGEIPKLEEKVKSLC